MEIDHVITLEVQSVDVEKEQEQQQEHEEEEVQNENEEEVEEGVEEGGDNENDESLEIDKKIKRRRSAVWDEFDDVKGTNKKQCRHCKAQLQMSGGTTSHFRRHLMGCARRMINQKSQKNLGFRSGKITSETSPIATFIYDYKKVRDSIAHFILMHEHSFSIVEQEGFNLIMKNSSREYIPYTRITTQNDCMEEYDKEKKKLKSLLKNVSKISLTTDMWKSCQQIEYMVVTGHFVDANWKLQKRVLNFVNIPPPRGGVDIADALFKCMTEWGIENKVYSLSVDNASYNDVAIRTLKNTFLRNKKLILDGKLFHVRCCAHILNLLVQDGIAAIDDVIAAIDDVIYNVRESVKFLKNSEARFLKFSEIVKQLQLSARKLILDVPTRWNSTFEMLSLALKFKDAFVNFKEREPLYHYLPTEEEWERVENVCQILSVFSTITNLISGSDYPTSNLFLSEMYRVKEVLKKRAMDNNQYIKAMVEKMNAKFEKYWGECNLLISIAAVLDPRCKMKLIEFCFPLIYEKSEVIYNIEKVRGALYEMYEQYACNFASTNEENSSQRSSKSQGEDVGSSSTVDMNSGWSKFDEFIDMTENAPPAKSDLDVYLGEVVYRCSQEEKGKWNALGWWRVNGLKYRILSKMASDVLAIPITTVASEATFSAGSRVIDTYRANLAPKTIEALMCGGDWVRNLHGLKKKSHKKEEKDEEFILNVP
ncbi:zinc finger BED domain-containing protein RICESLEEPER 2-like isoform X1 [Tripterygium wilfordii]|uniref:zinc finger BED domain-containing protein RICESLEEPER 2-like isoform X1 n=1 Tax=Tripterygium wilfordii TaxID=458696 RepID=UPI0018F802E5|nr:zinc finger BED domain-containing protein RICESLEEPER 2-like isoform X1 [Tripterygium wilfordii]